MRAAMVCSNVDLGFVVLNGLAANGIRPLLVCDEAAAPAFRSSRITSGTLFTGDLSSQQDRVVSAINDRHSREPIDIVLASDVAGLNCLHDIGDRLIPPTYPMPDRRTLDILNDKWNFHRFAAALGLPTPRTVFFADRRAIDADVVEREVGFPAVVKPVSAWSGRGLRTIVSRQQLSALRSDETYDFHGIVAQQFVTGRDIGLAMFARDGRPAAISTFLCGPRDATECVDMPAFAAMAADIALQTSYCGVANFDARLTADGSIWLLECNPRFFMRLRATRICGLDFIRLGLPGMGPDAAKARGNFYSRRDLASIGGLGRVLSGRWPVEFLMRDLGDALRDPWPLILRGLHSTKT
jgi:hypothetical protein